MSKSAHELTRRELYTQVWSRPMRDLAKEFGISDVALKKTCTRHNIPTPERGYWAKRAAGKAVKSTPLPDPRPNAPAVITVGGWSNPYMPESLEKTLAAIKRETFETVEVDVPGTTSIRSCSTRRGSSKRPKPTSRAGLCRRTERSM